VNAAIVHSFDEPPRYARGGHGYELFSSRRNRSTTSIRNPATSRVRFIQIGSSAGAKISLPAEALRSSGLELLQHRQNAPLGGRHDRRRNRLRHQTPWATCGLSGAGGSACRASVFAVSLLPGVIL